MKLSEDLAWRGLIKDRTFSKIAFLDTPKKFYLGIDASSDSLQIGNLAVIMLARRLAEAGWQAIILAGGGTSLVGDPGGKDEERELQTKEIIANNINSVQSQLQKLFAKNEQQLVNNLDWLKDLKYLNFLRDIGKFFPISELIQREFVDARLGRAGSGLSYAEFSYSLLQGYDFWWLYKHMDVQMQIGASDQWGNMLSGVALIRKKEDAEAHALSMPLVINKTTGKKFGKTEAGAIWLDSGKTSVFKFYQFWINTADSAVEDYLKVFSLLSQEQISQIMNAHNQDLSSRAAQKRLADEVTTVVHGADQARKQHRISKVITGELGIDNLGESELKVLREEMPYRKVQPGSSILNVLVETGLANSNSDARRLLDGRALYINGAIVDKPHLEASEFKNKLLMLRRGKAFKDSALIELS